MRCIIIFDGISERTIPAESSCDPILIWFVVILRSFVILDVKTALIFPRSICKAKKATASIGMRMKSILSGVC